MRTIMLLNAKGGSGKTTLATNLASWYASEGKAVALSDHDPQGSSLAWLAERPMSKPNIAAVEAGRNARRPPRGTDIQILDTPAGVHGTELSRLLRKAEAVIVPVLASPIDMRAAAEFVRLILGSSRIAQQQTRVGLVANRVREYTRVYAELEIFLRRLRVPILGQLRDSMNYVRAAENGLGIADMAPYATQIDRQQWAPILKWLRSKQSRRT